MGNSLTAEPLRAHRKTLDGIRPQMAKALNKVEEAEPWRDRVGDAVARTFQLAGVSQKEAAAAMDRDPAQIARWIAGTERPQFDALFAVERLRRSVVVALAEMAGDGVEIETVVRVRRSA